MNRLRWRLARWFAPVTIMASPGEGDGAWVMTRSGHVVMWVKADTLDLTVENTMRPLHFGLEYDPQPRMAGTFHGTFGSAPESETT